MTNYADSVYALTFPADTLRPAGAAFAPPPQAPYVSVDPLASLPPKAPAKAKAGYDPLTDKSPGVNPIDAGVALGRARGDIPQEQAPIGPPPPPPGGAPTGERPAIVQVAGGGYVGPRERSMLGPTQWAALRAANASQESAIGEMAGRTAQEAKNEEAMYMAHARDAQMRADAANAAALQRQEEMEFRIADFDRTAKQLAQEKINPDRFWASRTTPQKIASFISIGLGGFLAGARGGSNMGLDMVNDAINRDIAAQEANYKIRREGLEAQSTAFGMAMQKYQSVDAARAFARASAMDAVASEVARQQARWRGTEGANRATAALAELDQQRADQILKGTQFIQGGYVEPKYRLANRIGTYTGKEVDAMLGKEEERGFELEKEDRKIAGEIRKETAKNEGEDAKYISKSLESAGIPETRSAAEQARKALISTPKGYGERVFEYTPAGQSDTARKVAFGKGAAEREQTWSNYKNQAMKALMGNVTKDEERRANTALEGANDNESRLQAIKFIETILNDRESNIRKGASNRGNAIYDAREERSGGAKPLAGIKSYQPLGGR